MTHNPRLQYLLKGVGITAIMALVGIVVHVSGGTAFVWPHLMYVPLIWTAFEFGSGGGVVAGPIPVSVDLRIGIVLPRMAAATDELIQKASAAAHQARAEGAAFAIYDRARDDSSIKTLSLLGTLNTALQNHELALYFQPQIQIATGRVVGAETLIRWEHPREGLIPPDRYIAHAEKTWLVHPLSKFALETALQQLKTWQEKGVSLRLAVNLTARNLQEPTFMDDIFGLIDTYGLDPTLLEVEITERTMMTRFDIVSQSLNRLRKRGITIAIDDFGTGYSNLGLLAKLPVDYIKLDQQYIRELTTSSFSFSVVRRMIQAAKDLKLQTIAEGVESREIHDALAKLGCDLAQGYHISPPLPPDDFFSWIQEARADIS